MNQPFFSIVVPVYNVAGYVRNCLSSIQSQTFRDFECICVDDGSLDGSGAKIDEFVSDARFRVFHKQNGGVSSARNLALDHATGMWCVFVDGDDALVPWALEQLVEVIKGCPSSVDIIRYHEQRISNHEEPLSLWTPARVCWRGDLSLKPSLINGFERMVGGLIAWNACYRRSALGSLRFKPYPNGEDILFGAEAFLRANGVVEIDSWLYRYLHRSDSACHLISPKHVVSVFEVARELFVAVRESSVYSALKYPLRKKVKQQMFSFGLYYLKLQSDAVRLEIWPTCQKQLRMLFVESDIVLPIFRPFYRAVFSAFCVSWFFLGVPMRIKAWLLSYGWFLRKWNKYRRRS